MTGTKGGDKTVVSGGWMPGPHSQEGPNSICITQEKLHGASRMSCNAVAGCSLQKKRNIRSHGHRQDMAGEGPHSCTPRYWVPFRRLHTSV